MITEHTAKLVSLESGGKVEARYLTKSLGDILDPKPVDKRTSAEVISGIRKKL